MLTPYENKTKNKKKKPGKNGCMAMKLDMSKAYDRVKWMFLMKIMERMGFHSKWRRLIYECISSISFSVMVNRGTER